MEHLSFTITELKEDVKKLHHESNQMQINQPNCPHENTKTPDAPVRAPKAMLTNQKSEK